jgi:tetratricopeptide (TPR) repeat protein
MFEVFINYRTADARFGAAAAFELLAERFGRSRVFLDNQSMRPGAVYPEQIRSALSSMRVLLVLIGPDWMTGPDAGSPPIRRESDWVRREIRVAIRRGVPIVPVLLDGAVLPDPGQLPADVRPMLLHQTAQVRHRSLGADIGSLALHVARFVPARGSGWRVPRQVPASTHLVGREDELAQLDAFLSGAGDSMPRLVVIAGPAGVGKTALASWWAHHANADFSDGQLYVDLRGFGPDEPVAPQEALSGFLRALGVARPEELTTQAERSARFRTLLTGRRVVVVLDNARSAAQVEPLLPGTGPAVVIVTSRDLVSELRVRLLVACAGAQAARAPKAAARLAQQCGGLPLALRIVAERLVSRPPSSLAELVSELDDERERFAALSTLGPEANVRTVFSWSYRQIDGDHAAVFHALGLGPGRGVEDRTIAAVAGRPVDVVVRVLADLARAHLVTDVGDGRYGMHDLLHVYAGEVAAANDDPPPAAARRRLFDHYLWSAARADRLLTPHRVRISLAGDPNAGRGFINATAAKLWLQAEEQNLVALSRLDDPPLDEHRWQLAYVLRDYFYLTKQLDGWLETHANGLFAARRRGNEFAEALTLNNLGMAMTAGGSLDDAMRQFADAKEIFVRIGDRGGESNSLANMASVLRRQGDPAGALRLLEAAMSHYRLTGSANHIGITLRSMANAHLHLGQPAEALRCAQEAVDLATFLEFQLDIAQAGNVLGAAHRQLGDLVLAEIAHRQALEMGESCESEFEQAWAHRGLGSVALADGRATTALAHWQTARSLFQAVGSSLADEVAADIGQLVPPQRGQPALPAPRQPR